MAFPGLPETCKHIFGGEGRIYGGPYIRDVNWVKYLGGICSVGGLYTGDVLMGFYRILVDFDLDIQ